MTARIVAFVGCLVSALLPLGQMPKVAGPCGRELCECVVRVQTKTCSGRDDCPFRAPEARLVFDGPSFSASVPGTILITVLSDFRAPEVIQVPQPSSQKIVQESPRSQLFSLTSVTHEIATPPPRA